MEERRRERNLRRCEAQFFTQAGILEVFKEIDKEQDGYLSKREVEQALRDLNLRVSEKDLTKLFDLLQSGGDNGLITLEQFTHFVRQRQVLLAEVFCTMDTSQDGVLESREIRDALRRAGINPTQQEIRLLIEELDTTNTGKVEFREFCRAFLLCPEIDIQYVFTARRRSLEAGIDKGETSYSLPSETSYSAWKILLAGGVAGAVSRTATAPFDRLKVLLQAGGKVSGQEVTGILSGMRAIFQEGGFRAYFRGNGTNVIKIAPESAVKFFAYERLKLVVGKDPHNLTGLERFVAGALAGVIAQSSIYPLEVTKTRLAVSPTGTYKGIADCIYHIYRHEGPRALFRGLGTSLSGIVPYAGVDMSVFFTLKEAWLLKHPDKTPGVLVLLAMGATSSFCGQITAYPLQLVRTRLQAQGLPGTPVKYTGMSDCFFKVYQEGGVRAFYRGIAPNFMKAIPAISISYVIYEKAKDVLGV